jgi:hypothetical protein
MIKVVNSKKAVVAHEDSYKKVILTPFGNIAKGTGLLFPNIKCLISEAMFYGTCELGSSYVKCHTAEWKNNICRLGCRYELDPIAPMTKKMASDDLVFFEVWKDDEEWNQY